MPATRGRSRLLHGAFEIGITAKALVALVEALSGIALLFIQADWVHTTASWLTAGELGEDPTDLLSRWILRVAETYDISAQHFWSAYLIGHGLVKLVSIGALIAGFRWAFPLAILVLFGFIVWQFQKWLATGSVFMVGVSIFDLAVIWLIWQEWRTLPKPS